MTPRPLGDNATRLPVIFFTPSAKSPCMWQWTARAERRVMMSLSAQE